MQQGVRSGALGPCHSRTAVSPRSRRAVSARAADDRTVYLLDYGAGNVRSVRNAVQKLGFNICDVQSPLDIPKASRLLFPGVGALGSCMDILKSKGYVQPLVDYLNEGKPFYGICLGLQVTNVLPSHSAWQSRLAVAPCPPGALTR